MIQKIKNLLGKARKVVTSRRFAMVMVMALCGTAVMLAQNSAGDYSAGTSAIGTVSTEIAKYVPYVTKLCYAIAGVVAVVGAISVYIAMNNEEQDVKKKIMMIVGACIFLIAAAQALPMFFGITNS
jgi:type IV secretory pathway VirB2 component (pilin)